MGQNSPFNLQACTSLSLSLHVSLQTADLITSSPQCLHNLVMWIHNHAESCQTAPSLQSVLSSEYCGIIRAVWGCGEGHDYVMSTDSDCSSLLVDASLSVKQDLPKGTTAALETGNGVAADRVGTAAATAPEPQQSLPRTGDGHPPANTGTALPVLSTENPLPECQDLPSSQAENGAALQEKSLPQPACPLNGGPGKRFSWNATATCKQGWEWNLVTPRTIWLLYISLCTTTPPQGLALQKAGDAGPDSSGVFLSAEMKLGHPGHFQGSLWFPSSLHIWAPIPSLQLSRFFPK